jgi:origin recognition complex subunit 5
VLDEFGLAPPPEDARIRLTRLFTPSLTAAFEALYPRLTNASSWAHENTLESGFLAQSPKRASALKPKSDWKSQQHSISADVLPRMSKFILVAAFLASTNPAKTDLRMFGRGQDENKKKRRKGGGPRRGSGKNVVAKVGVFIQLIQISPAYLSGTQI